MKVIFLDRDGVINRYPGNFEYVKSWEEFKFLPGVKPALIRLLVAGFKLFVISNQAGVSKGAYSQATLDKITRNMTDELSRDGVLFDGIYYCTHLAQDNCDCRKPKAGLVKKAIAKLKNDGVIIDIPESYFIGDSIKDVEAGKSVGLRTILVFSGREKPENRDSWDLLPDFTASDLSDAADLIIKNLK